MEGFLEDQVKSALEIPDGVRVVALPGLGKGAGLISHMLAAVREICFVERWAKPIDF